MDKFLSPKQVGEVLGVDPECVRYMIRAGTIPAKQVGRRWFVAKDWLYQPSNRKVKESV